LPNIYLRVTFLVNGKYKENVIGDGLRNLVEIRFGVS
jgi:hypothetical protein